MKPPTFFLSSTIYDFRDLRSAIKFTLEARGCRVLASEFNDFGGDLDKHSYEACITNINQADYFVLVIGGRVGGWYDKNNRISITQQEYRAAYERHKSGLLKIIILVRAEIWQLREDRKALERHLNEMSLEDSERAAISGYPSKFANDAAFVSAFLSEVGRNSETAIAIQQGTAKPTGNWINTFRDFRDIHDVLHPLVFSGKTSDEAAFAKALQHELIEILGRLLIKHNGKPLDMRSQLHKYLIENPIDMDARLEDEFPVENAKWQNFSTILMQTMAVQFDLVVTEDALTSSLFLNFDSSRGSYIQSPAYEGLFRLVEEIRMFKSANISENLELIFEYSPKNLGRPKNETIYLPTQRLAFLYGLAHRWINIVSLSSALIVHLEGRAFEMPALMPFSPIQGLEDKIKSERVNSIEVRAFLDL